MLCCCAYPFFFSFLSFRTMMHTLLVVLSLFSLFCLLAQGADISVDWTQVTYVSQTSTTLQVILFNFHILASLHLSLFFSIELSPLTAHHHATTHHATTHHASTNISIRNAHHSSINHYHCPSPPFFCFFFC